MRAPLMEEVADVYARALFDAAQDHDVLDESTRSWTSSPRRWATVPT